MPGVLISYGIFEEELPEKKSPNLSQLFSDNGKKDHFGVDHFES